MSVCTYEARDGWRCTVKPRDGGDRCAKHRPKGAQVSSQSAQPTSKRVQAKPVMVELITVCNQLDESDSDDMNSVKSHTDDDDSDPDDNLSRVSCVSDDDVDEFGKSIDPYGIDDKY